MRGVTRWLFQLGAGISLMIFIAVGVLWWRGKYQWVDIVQRNSVVAAEDHLRVVNLHTMSAHGEILASVTFETATPPRGEHWKATPAAPAKWQWVHGMRPRNVEFDPLGRCGFSCRFDKERRETRHGNAVDRKLNARVPCWFSCLASGVLPGWWITRRKARLRKRRRARNLCEQCGYDVRASAERCPECGTQVPQTTPVGVAS
jgi:hypothetical protein